MKMYKEALFDRVIIIAKSRKGRKGMEDKIILPRLKLKKQKKNGILEKMREHKTEIIIVGVLIASAVGVIMIVKKWDAIKGQTVVNLYKNGVKINDSMVPPVGGAIEKASNKIPSNVRVIDVRKHIRNLPEGWKASPQKVDLAMKSGIVLGLHQTLVDDYSKLCA